MVMVFRLFIGISLLLTSLVYAEAPTPFFEKRDFAVSRNFVNGSFKESFNALVTSDGATITMTLTNASGGNLTMQFSDGDTTLIAPDTIELTAGSDASPQNNYIYIPQSTKILTKSTSDWPHGTEHIRIGYFLLQSVSMTQTDGGALINHNINDELSGTSGLGHLLHIGERIRQEIQYDDGLNTTVTITTNSGAKDNVDLAIASGHSFQFHRHTINAWNSGTGDKFKVVNHSSGAYEELEDLNELLTDSTGASLVNRTWAIVVAMAANKTGEFVPTLVTAPSCSYTKVDAAKEDPDGCTVLTFPDEFTVESSVLQPITRLIFSHSSASGGTWTLEDQLDIRKNPPTNIIGTGGTPLTDFPDNDFTVFGNLDNSKVIAFDIDTLISASTTRTYQTPDHDGIMNISGAAFDQGAFEIRALTFQSDVTTGTAPLGVSSITVVTNLNADLLDGFHVGTSRSAIPDMSAMNTWSADQIHSARISLEDNKILGFGTESQGGSDAEFDHDGAGTLTLEQGGGGGLSFTDFLIRNADVTFENETKGTKESVLLSNNAGGTSSTGSSIPLKAGEVIFTATKGLTMVRAGSIVGISVNYDVTAITLTPTLVIRVIKNGSIVWTNSISATVGNNKEEQFTQARNTDTFVAGDTVVVDLQASGVGADATIDDIIVMLEWYYN